MTDNWIEEATKNKGGLHKALGIGQDKKIPVKALDKALKSKNETVRKQATLAKTLKNSKRGK